MAKYKVIDLTLSDSDSDGDFIQAKKAIHPFLYQVSVYYIKFLNIKFLLHQVSEHQVSITSSSYYNRNYFTGLVYIVMYSSHPNTDRLIYIARS